MKDQLNFGSEFVSEADIIRQHYKRLGSIGGKTITERKSEAARKNAKLATLARIQKTRRDKENAH